MGLSKLFRSPSPGTRPGRPGPVRRPAARLSVESLERRDCPAGMSLVGNWHEHDHLYADVWGQRITSGPHRGDYAYLGHFANQGGIDIINVTDPTHPVLASTFLGTGGDNELQD